MTGNNGAGHQSEATLKTYQMRAERTRLKKHGFFYRCSQRNGALPAGWIHREYTSNKNGKTTKRFSRKDALLFIDFLEKQK